MAMTKHHELTEAERMRPYADVPTTDLVETLQAQYGRGEPFDMLMVAEVCTRAMLADDPRYLTRGRISGMSSEPQSSQSSGVELRLWQ